MRYLEVLTIARLTGLLCHFVSPVYFLLYIFYFSNTPLYDFYCVLSTPASSSSSLVKYGHSIVYGGFEDGNCVVFITKHSMIHVVHNDKGILAFS